MATDLSLEHGKLRADVATVRAYGEAHPEAWVGLRFENEPSVRIVALFAGGHLDIHRDALRRLVSFPDQLEVHASPWTLTRLQEIGEEIHHLATSSDPGLFEGRGGSSRGKVSVRLRADGEPMAASLLERYGDAVDITVGFLVFPERRSSEHGVRLLSVADRALPPLLPARLRMHAVEPLRVRSGASLRSTVRLDNEGATEVVVDTNGQLTALVVDPETNEVVGGYSGAQTLPLIRFSAPGGGAQSRSPS